METDDAVNLIESLEPEEQKKLLAKVNPDDRELIEESFNYPEDSAGRRMQKEFVSMPTFWSVGQAIDYLRENPELPQLTRHDRPVHRFARAEDQEWRGHSALSLGAS